jgi:hypothetical protein
VLVVTVTVLESLTVPLAFEQVIVNVVDCVKAGLVSVPPETDLEPDQVPVGELEAVHDVAFVGVQVSDVVAPEFTVYGLAVRDTVGNTPATWKVTLVVCVTVAPEPVIVKV